MANVQPSKSTRGARLLVLLKNYHLWLLILLMAVIILMYSVWPWREWQFNDGIWPMVSWLSVLYQLSVFEVTHYMVGMLFFLPILYATIVFSWQGSLVTTVVSMFSVNHIILGYWNPTSFMINIVLLFLPLLLMSVVSVEVFRRRREREYLAERENERRVFVARLIEAQEMDRQRISQDLHDETIQNLLAVGRSLEILIGGDSITSDSARARVASIRDITFGMVDDIRGICVDLRPSILDNLGLVPALRWLVDQHTTDGNLLIRVTTTGPERRLTPNVELVLFRIAQEAVNNIMRHSRATHAMIDLEFSDERVHMVVEDDGIGFTPASRMAEYSNDSKMGLIGMKQRAESVNAEFAMHSAPGEGTILTINIGASAPSSSL